MHAVTDLPESPTMKAGSQFIFAEYCVSSRVRSGVEQPFKNTAHISDLTASKFQNLKYGCKHSVSGPLLVTWYYRGENKRLRKYSLQDGSPYIWD